MKTKSSKSRNIDIFPKGLTHGYGPKMAIFPTFFFGIRGQKNVFYNIVEQKTPFYNLVQGEAPWGRGWPF